MQLTIGDRTYQTKKAAADACRLVLYRYPVGSTIVGVDHAFLSDLIELHPERDLKLGGGVQSFQVEQNGLSRGFWLTRVDGSRTDFSFLACLTPPTKERQAMAAFRAAVKDQIAEFRRGNTEWTCPITGDLLSESTAHIDHDPPFTSLVASFLAARNIKLGQVAVSPTVDASTITFLADPNLARDWSAFHRTHARLRAVSARANLSKGDRK